MPELPSRTDGVSGMDVYERIAVCQNRYGEGHYVPAEDTSDERCFTPGCGCTPRIYVAEDHRRGAVSPDRWECPICEALIVPQHFERHLTRHDGDGTPRERVDAAWLAFTDHQRGAVSASELLATLEREAPDDDAPTAYRNGYDAALMTARMVVGSASDRPQGAV